MTQMLLSRLTMALDGFAELKAVDKTTPAQHARHIDGDRILVWLLDFASSRPCSPSSDTNSIDIQLFETERLTIFKVFTCFPMPPFTGTGRSATTSSIRLARGHVRSRYHLGLTVTVPCIFRGDCTGLGIDFLHIPQFWKPWSVSIALRCASDRSRICNPATFPVDAGPVSHGRELGA